MIGVSDFCGHYEWTFEWLRAQGGEDVVREYWDAAIHRDAQRHAGELIRRDGFAGMAAYWAQTLEHEAAGCHTTLAPDRFRMDMHQCPSKGFLLRNGLEQYHDYCDHCLGWVGPLMKAAGFVVDHEHNHAGQCWWEFRRAEDPRDPSRCGELAGEFDVRHLLTWRAGKARLDVYRRANDPRQKQAASST
jgi:hypothetical protein